MQLAELNVGYAAHDLDDPRMAGFMDNLDRINTLAERSPGFVWRMKSDSGNATDIPVPGDPKMISNLSVWEDVPSLANYVFNTVHARFYDRKVEWFQPMQTPHFVMWWVEDGHIPTLEEATARLAELTEHGSTDRAFGWDAVDMTNFRQCMAAE